MGGFSSTGTAGCRAVFDLRKSNLEGKQCAQINVLRSKLLALHSLV